MIEILQTKAQRTSRQNLAAYIHRARHDCAAFGSDLDWDRPDWDVTRHSMRPANKSHGKAVIYFTTHDGGTSKSMAGRTPLPDPLCSLLKAIVRLKQDASPQTADPPMRIVNAARDLSLELADRNFDPCLLLPGDFAAAARRVKKRASGKTAYRLGQALEHIATIIDEEAIGFIRLDWKNPIARVANNGSRQSETAVQARETNIPTTDVFDSLAEIWNVVEDPSDIILMGAVTLLHCAPWRIVEALGIGENCEVEEQRQNANGPVFTPDGVGVFRYGLRYWKEKSGDPDLKWIPTVMVDVARQAVERVREHTADARGLAQWLHDNPGRAWLPGPDHGPDQPYTTKRVQQMLNLSSRPAALQWLYDHNVPLLQEVYGDGRGRTWGSVVKRRDLEAALLSEMPTIPDHAREAPLHERMFISFRHSHHAKRRTNPCLLEIISDQQIRDFLGGRETVESAFERLLDRADLKARTHQFRHWLNTIAQSGGLEQHLIARWSGRDDVAQNSEYDHVDPTYLARKARELFEQGKARGALADFEASLPPVERSEFRETVIATAHVTDIGFCLQDWNTSPCPEHGACPTCESCAVIKGDKAAIERTDELRADTAWIAERLEAEVTDGTLGASQHYAAATATLAALDRIKEIHDNPDIPDGVLVQLNVTSPDHHGGPPIRNAA